MFRRVTVKYNGRYYDYPIEDLDLNQESPVDVEILSALSNKISAETGIEVNPNFRGFVVDPPQAERLGGQHEDKEVISVRPTAEYGHQP